MIHVKITANKYVTADFAVRMARRSHPMLMSSKDVLLLSIIDILITYRS